MSQNHRQTVYTYEEVKEIAIAYAKLCLEKAAEDALCKKKYDRHSETYIDDYIATEDGGITVYKPSITNIELP